jgi:hypothetical protein
MNRQYKIKKICCLSIVIAMLVFSCYLHNCVLGEVYDFMSVGSNIECSAPSVILQEGLDDISLIYANCTSAKIIIDATTEYKTYNYTLSIVNNVSENYEIRLEVYDHQNISRLSNLTVLLHDNNTFVTQIVIENGVITQASGNFYILNGFSTAYVKVENLKESQDGESHLYVYLRIKIPNGTIYTLYFITFELN